MTARKTTLAMLAIACALAISACSKESAEGEHAGTETPHASSSAGLPSGNAATGKELATAKGASGQACVDCHGADGAAPIDASYQKIGGQYADYLAHSLQGYRSGQRGGTPTTDLMAGQAKELTDQQIADLAAYFASASSPLRDLHGAE